MQQVMIRMFPQRPPGLLLLQHQNLLGAIHVIGCCQTHKHYQIRSIDVAPERVASIPTAGYLNLATLGGGFTLKGR